jgi:hypothetical protein
MYIMLSMIMVFLHKISGTKVTYYNYYHMSVELYNISLAEGPKNLSEQNLLLGITTQLFYWALLNETK